MLTSLIYGVPKLCRGMALDDPPTDEVKADQKAFFRLLYNLLVAADRGPASPPSSPPSGRSGCGGCSAGE